MSFDIKKHILDHAAWVIDLMMKRHNKKSKHFNTSCDTAYFIVSGYDTQEKIDKVMRTIMQNISQKQMSFKEKNGVYVNRFGVKRQKYRTRIIKFDNLLSAYHNSHFDNSKSVNPHFHYLIPDNARVGIGYQYLMVALQKEATTFGLKFNFMEESQQSILSKSSQQIMKRFSWHLHQGDMKKIEKYLCSKVSIDRHLKMLVDYYHETQNLSFFIKSMKIINQRLDELDIDYIYKAVNLKDDIFFFLSNDNMHKIQKLQQYDKVSLDLSNVFDREILKYTYGFGSEAMDVIVDKFNIYDIQKDQLHIINTNLNYDVKNKVNPNNEFREYVISDIRTAISHARNEKDIKELLIDSGAYKKISMKTQKLKDGKRKKIGFNVTTEKNSKLFIPFWQLDLSMSNITKVLMYNQKKNRYLKPIQSKIKSYRKKEPNIKKPKLTIYEYRVKLLLEFYPKEINNFGEKSYEKIADKYHISRSEMYHITTFRDQENKTTIVDYGDKITLKRLDINITRVVSDMLDIAQMKGWGIDTLNIKGSAIFIKEAKKQIVERLNLTKSHSMKLKL